MGGGLPTNNHLALEVVGHSFTSPPSHRTLVVISALGHPRPIDDVCAISASPPIVTDLLHHGEGRKGPSSDIDLLNFAGPPLLVENGCNGL
jgi:hypothetical protein